MKWDTNTNILHFLSYIGNAKGQLYLESYSNL